MFIELCAGATREGNKTHGQSGVEPPVREPLMIRGRPSLSAAVALLQAQGPPVSDLTEEHLEYFFYISPDSAPTGLVGLELHRTDALLRSLVGAENAGANGFGLTLIERAEQYAALKCVRSIYLLTTAAESALEGVAFHRTNARVCGPLPGNLGVHV
jgi:amino-acid N-acetyltransferase